MRGTASIDQSKLSVLGHSSILALAAGRYRNVRPRVSRDGCLAVGLSALANSGLLPASLSRPSASSARPPDRMPTLRPRVNPQLL